MDSADSTSTFTFHFLTTGESGESSLTIKISPPLPCHCSQFNTTGLCFLSVYVEDKAIMKVWLPRGCTEAIALIGKQQQLEQQQFEQQQFEQQQLEQSKPSTAMRLCKGINRDGTPCNRVLAPQARGDYCKIHRHQSPKAKASVQRARAKAKAKKAKSQDGEQMSG